MNVSCACSLAGLGIALEGGGETSDYLASELAGLPSSPGAGDLDIHIVDSLPPLPRGAVRSRQWIGWEGGFRYIRPRLEYQVERTGTALRVSLRQPRPADFSAPLRRFLDWNYLTRAQQVAKDFMYSVFNPLTGSELQRRGLGAYIHASSLSLGGRGLAILATGGVGKTTSMLRLVTDHGWHYLSDDIGIIDARGELWRSPLRMQVYAYNVQGQPRLANRLLRGRGWADRASWHVRHARHGPAKVRRRVSAEELFGAGQVADHAPLELGIYLERAHVDAFEVLPMTAAELADRLVLIMPTELGGLDAQSDALAITPARGLVPSPEEFREGLRAMLSRAFAGRELLRVRVPVPASPDELLAQLLPLVAPRFR